MIHTYRHRYHDSSVLVLRLDSAALTFELLTPVLPSNVAEHRRFMHEVVMPDIRAYSADRPTAVKVTA